MPLKHAGRDLYQFSSPQGMLFCADDQTLVLVLRFDAVAERDKQVLTTSPRTGSSSAPGKCGRWWRSALAAQLWWTAAEIDRPGIMAGMLPLGAKNPDLTKRLKA